MYTRLAIPDGLSVVSYLVPKFHALGLLGLHQSYIIRSLVTGAGLFDGKLPTRLSKRALPFLTWPSSCRDTSQGCVDRLTACKV
jgi:hypothetical protein